MAAAERAVGAACVARVTARDARHELASPLAASEVGVTTAACCGECVGVRVSERERERESSVCEGTRAGGRQCHAPEARPTPHPPPPPPPPATLLPPATPHGPHRALAPASLVAPFVAPVDGHPPGRRRRALGEAPPRPGRLTADRPTLIPGAVVTVTPLAGAATDGTGCSIAATVVGAVTIGAADGALARLAEAGWLPAWPSASSSSTPAHAAAFVVLKLEAPPPPAAVAAAATLWGGAAPPPPARGALLLAVAAPLAPLAPRLFGGLVLAAAVAAPLAPDTEAGGGGARDAPLVLVDAPSACAPGAEGGPVVCGCTGAFVGVLAPPLSRDGGGGGAGSQLPLIVTARRLASALGAWQEARPHPPPAVVPAAAAASDAVAAVYVPGATWAAAVHVGGGAFATVAHAVAGAAADDAPSSSPARPLLLQLRPPQAPPVWARARALPASALPASTAGLDVAGLVLVDAAGARTAPPSWLPAAVLAPETPEPGTPVTILGFPHIHPTAGIGPLASSGVCGRLLAPTPSSPPELMVSTAAVVPGASGGPAVDAQGRVVGLAVCAARVGGGAPLPHLNAVLCGAPLAAAWGAIKEHGEGERSPSGAGETLSPPPAAARAALWALADPPPLHPRREGRAALEALVAKL